MNDARRLDIERQVADWFAAHYGVINRKAALRLGMSSDRVLHRLRSGEWITIHRGVYQLAAFATGPLTYLHAAVLAAGETAVVSHRSAAWLHGMQGRVPRVPTLTVPRNRFVRVDGIHAVRSRRPLTSTHCKGVPCTAPIQTLMDCAAVAGSDELDALVDQALARHVINAGDLERASGEPCFRHHRGRLAFDQRLAARGVTGSPNPSVLESRAARLIQRQGLPVPKAEVTWGRDQRYRLDFAYPHLRLVIEVDGWSSHMAPEKQRYDNIRSNALNLTGWTVLHYDWWQITYQGDQVAAQILEAYRRLAA